MFASRLPVQFLRNTNSQRSVHFLMLSYAAYGSAMLYIRNQA